MRWTLGGALVLLAAGLSADDKAGPFRFGKGDVGKLPAGWKAAQTGEGKGSVWKVVADKDAPSKSGHALAQLAEGPTQLYNLCLAERTLFQDGTLSVRLKAVAGEIDQGGGVLWRCRDANNYYICRYNPLEKNFRVYKVVKGKRFQLATREGILPRAGHWYTLSVSQQGDRITCSLDGKKLLEVKDGTFPEAGTVGLWTKADAVTHFDDLTISAR